MSSRKKNPTSSRRRRTARRRRAGTTASSDHGESRAVAADNRPAGANQRAAGSAFGEQTPYMSTAAR
jgi:hypothetical protein